MGKDVKAYMKEFDAKFSKLKSNRAKIPLNLLTTKYAKAYNALVEWLEEYAVWFTEEYINHLALPEPPQYVEWNIELEKKIEAIKTEEKKPGGLYQRIRDSLINNLNEQEFDMNVWRLYDRLEKEAWDPYQQRFNRWVGPPDNRRIYNDLFEAFWIESPDPTNGGYWADEHWKCKRLGYPPKIGPDPEGGKTE